MENNNFYNFNLNNEYVHIDAEAKINIDLMRHLDTFEKPYYTGKLQFPGTIDFSKGVSFMVFISENGVEQLQIGSMNPNKKTRQRPVLIKNNKLTINLHPMFDKNDNTYYIGEVFSPGELNLFHGLFFTIFISNPGYEEIQITKLQHKSKLKENNDF